jgi:Fe-S oxidoreductase/FAD/FMN-containing dehydrogenase
LNALKISGGIDMNESQKLTLTNTVKHVTFDETERMLYGHDIGALPSLIRPLVGNTIPDAIVQPENETELKGLVGWANNNSIPITPRGKATSGYGGVLPVKGGVVVDFWRLKDVISIDEINLTATVEPGITWEKLDKALLKKGLTLCMYPSSYPAATVGGWLAQGGAGFGSYQFGYFRDIVIAAKAVLSSGEVREFKDYDLDFVYEAEGITGIISEVTIRVQPYEELDYCSFTCPDAVAVKNVADEIMNQKLPIWAMLFINPKMAEFKRIAPVREHHGHPAEEQANLPSGDFVMTLAFKKSVSGQVRGSIAEIIKCCDCQMLPQEIADHEWENRFRLMVVKRLGPSLAPVEVIVPLKTMPQVFEEINAKVGQPIVKEAVIIPKGRNGKPEVVILGFIPCDQRRFGYNFVFALALTVMKIAEKNGGRAYSTGLYFTSKAKQVLGKDRLKKIAGLKKEIDPKGILNPEKVLGGGLLKLAMQIAPLFEPITRALGNSAKIHVGEKPVESIKGIPPEVVWYAYSCSQCGYCVDECDQYYGRGWESQSPRGKWYWLRQYLEGKKKWDQKMVDTFIVCTTCELCNNRCSAALPIEQSWMKLRGKLITDDKRMTFPPFAMMEKATLAEGDIWAGYRKDRDAWFPKDLMEKHGPDVLAKNAYFAGCTASYVENDIGIASVRLLNDAGVDFSYVGKSESCCGTPLLVAGKWDTFTKIMNDNIAAVKAKGADTVISSCPACDMMWRHVYPVWAKKLGMNYDITAKHYSEIVAEKIDSGEFKFPEKLPAQTVTWHDSCHAGRVSGIYDPPRKLIEAIPNITLVEMENNRECAHCCGSVLTLIKEPDVAAFIGKDRLEEAEATGAEKVLALCPCCEFQLRVSADKANSKVQVEDLAAFAAKALGYELPDPHPEVKAQWEVFEGMIALMTPKGFADLMATMWPELIKAMPFGMGYIMRFFGKKLSGMLDLMKPMLPILFPILLPMMMPKVMPSMLARVAAKVPMPLYMQEQMPSLMPKVMDELMPHMISDVVPLVTGPMINYLKSC